MGALRLARKLESEPRSGDAVTSHESPVALRFFKTVSEVDLTSPTQSTASMPAHYSSRPLPRATCSQISSSRPRSDPRSAYSAKHCPPSRQFPSRPNHAWSQSQSPAASTTPESDLPPQSSGRSNSSPPAIHQTKTPLALLHSLRQTPSEYAKSQ